LALALLLLLLLVVAASVLGAAAWSRCTRGVGDSRLQKRQNTASKMAATISTANTYATPQSRTRVASTRTQRAAYHANDGASTDGWLLLRVIYTHASA